MVITAAPQVMVLGGDQVLVARNPHVLVRGIGAQSAAVVVLGAHGGAGTSTLALLLEPALDLGTFDHRADGFGTEVGGRPVVVVARNTVAAAWYATQAVTVLHEAGACLAALVVVADGAGSEPRDAAARFGLLEGRVGGVVRVPFIPVLRLVDDVRAVSLPEKVLRAVGQVRALATVRHS